MIAFLSANLGYRHVKKPENEVGVSVSGAESEASGMVTGKRPVEEDTSPVVDRASAEDVFAELREAARTRDKDSLRRLRKGGLSAHPKNWSR